MRAERSVNLHHSAPAAPFFSAQTDLSGVRGHLRLYFVMLPLAKARGSAQAMIAEGPFESPIRAQTDSDGAFPGSTPVMKSPKPNRVAISSRACAPRTTDNR